MKLINFNKVSNNILAVYEKILLSLANDSKNTIDEHRENDIMIDHLVVG